MADGMPELPEGWKWKVRIEDGRVCVALLDHCDYQLSESSCYSSRYGYRLKAESLAREIFYRVTTAVELQEAWGDSVEVEWR